MRLPCFLICGVRYTQGEESGPVFFYNFPRCYALKEGAWHERYSNYRPHRKIGQTPDSAGRRRGPDSAAGIQRNDFVTDFFGRARYAKTGDHTQVARSERSRRNAWDWLLKLQKAGSGRSVSI